MKAFCNCNKKIYNFKIRQTKESEERLMTSTYFLNCIMGNVFKTKTTPVLPEKVYLGLSSSEPDIDGTNVTEPSTLSGYSRIELTEKLGEPNNGVISNTADISFPESSASWGTITHFVIYDSESDGNLLMFESLTQNRSVETATIVTIKAGNLTVTLANPA